MTWQTEYQHWLNFEGLDPSLKAELVTLSESELEEAFGTKLSFGTAGMRGILGPGINRMNIYTVRQASEGLAQLILSQGEKAKQSGVVIAYDSRHMSPEFAMETAKVLAHHEIKAYVYESLRPTPVLSFAVRHLSASAGVMITASHNPSEYNGYKVYGADGGQMPPVDSDRLTRFVREVEDPLTVQVINSVDVIENPLIEMIGDQVDQAYLTEVSTVTINHDLISEFQDKIKLVFTPLHGTGFYLGEKALKQAGFQNLHIVEAQKAPDGDFPTVKSPNPESEEAFDLAKELAKEVKADIILATDPDADRLGAMVLNEQGDYQLLTGNQIACLMLDYLLNALVSSHQLPGNGVAIKSMVSTDLAKYIAESYGIELLEVLTGFKFIAEKIKNFETSGEKTFLMGFEESYGYLIKAFTRDKDAIQALILLAELTTYHKHKGHSLGQALNNLYKKFGYFSEITHSIVFPGITGSQKMTQLMESIRKHPITKLNQREVVQWIDYHAQTVSLSDGTTNKTELPKADALKAYLDDGSWFAMRPSGTEPKLKVYVGAKAEDHDLANRKAQVMLSEISKHFE